MLRRLEIVFQDGKQIFEKKTAPPPAVIPKRQKSPAHVHKCRTHFPLHTINHNLHFYTRPLYFNISEKPDI